MSAGGPTLGNGAQDVPSLMSVASYERTPYWHVRGSAREAAELSGPIPASGSTRDGHEARPVCTPDRILNLGCSDGLVASEQLVSFTSVKLGRSEASGGKEGMGFLPIPSLPPTGQLSNSVRWLTIEPPLRPLRVPVEDCFQTRYGLSF